MSKKKTVVDQFAMGNSARRMAALGDLIADKQLTRLEGAKRINVEFGRLIKAGRQGGRLTEEEAGQVIYGLGLGLTAAMRQLKCRGPMLVRVIDPKGIKTWVMPEGPPN